MYDNITHLLLHY